MVSAALFVTTPLIRRRFLRHINKNSTICSINFSSIHPPLPPLLFNEEFKFKFKHKQYHHHALSSSPSLLQQQQKLLQACSRARYLDDDSTKILHTLSITMDWSGSEHLDQPILISINNSLISAYASLGELSTSRKVFDRMSERNVVSYNSMIAAFSRPQHQEENELGGGGGGGGEAWQIFTQMMVLGFKPTQFTFGSLLSSSSSLNLAQGFQLHSLILKTGLLYVDAFSGTALLGLFGRLGKLDEALSLFDEMPTRNLVTWNSIISSFGRHGFVEESLVLFRELLRSEEVDHPSESSFVGVLSGFGFERGGLQDLKSVGEQIHVLVKKSGLEFYPSVANSVLNMYAKCSMGTCFAEQMFEEMLLFWDVVSWNIIIGTFARSDRPGKAFDLFLIMLQYGFLPTQTTFANVISSCSSLQNLNYGEVIHAKTVKNGFKSDVFVGSALVDFYAKCDNLEAAHLVFAELHIKNDISWNALISGYSIKGSRISIYLLQEMLRSGYQPNEFLFSAILKSALIQEMQQLHCLILRMGYQNNEYVFSSLIASYAMNGLISDALTFATALTPPLSPVSSNIIAGIYNRIGQYQETQKLLFQVEEHDIISWNILIAACARNGDYREVFELFKSMQMAQILPDNYTVMSLLSITSKLCNLALGSSIHGLIIKMDFKCCDIFVCNVLLDMYAKCGSLESSVKVFNEMTERKNLISWTSLVSALGLHGYAFEALERFREMELTGLKPDRVAFIAVLSACRHGGLVEEGMELFRRMKVSYGIEPDMDHYVCVVDLLARYGHLREAERLISSMPFRPNALIWRTFLEGCKRCNNVVEEQAVGQGRMF
ncbi:Pentatricopeptide repeat [Macleaya cordata]|uniref:Pentatricopeptide repeat n=1 Tax=Macleaya cordata TaxID=56857 RepID=A0A200PYA7_MACCD|nr:Pentatricopeptide repeat [Macleaya cordata]